MRKHFILLLLFGMSWNIALLHAACTHTSPDSEHILNSCLSTFNENSQERANTLNTHPPRRATSMPARLSNISVRCPFGRGGERYDYNQAVAGFVISGTQPKKLLIRAQDSSLPDGVQRACVTLYTIDGSLAHHTDSNCFWKNHASHLEIQNLSSHLIPPHDADAAMIVDLNPGVYTVEAYGNDFIGMLAIDDLDDASVDSRLVNMSGRCLLEDSPRHAVIGWVVEGTSQQSLSLLVRATYTSVTQQASIFDPRLDLYHLDLSRAQATVWDSVDNWGDHDSKACVLARPVSQQPASVRDAAFCTMLPSGVYTGEVNANISGVANMSVDVLP